MERAEKQMFPRVHVVGGSDECRGRGLGGGGCEGGWEGNVKVNWGGQKVPVGWAGIIPPCSSKSIFTSWPFPTGMTSSALSGPRTCFLPGLLAKPPPRTWTGKKKQYTLNKVKLRARSSQNISGRHSSARGQKRFSLFFAKGSRKVGF